MTTPTSEPLITVRLDPVRLAANYLPVPLDRWVTLTVTPPGGVPHGLTGWVCNVADVGAYPQPVGPYLMVHFDIPDDDGDVVVDDLLTSGLLVVQDADAVARVYDPPPGVRPPRRTGGRPREFLGDIAVERHRQIEAEGWTPEHDDEHTEGELIFAAVAYLLHARGNGDAAQEWWPWDPTGFKSSDTRRELVKAGALVAAEVDRLDRRQARAADGPTAPAPSVLWDDEGDIAYALGEWEPGPFTSAVIAAAEDRPRLAEEFDSLVDGVQHVWAVPNEGRDWFDVCDVGTPGALRLTMLDIG